MGSRDQKGRFTKGASGNPGGRVRGLAQLRELARDHSARAIETLAAAMDDEDPRVRVAAAVALLDRGWGKPTPDEGDSGALELHRIAAALTVEGVREARDRMCAAAGLAPVRALPPAPDDASPLE